MTITEDLLYYIWRFLCFDLKQLKSKDGQFIQILETGTRNIHAGPDFTMAKIKIGDQIWAGNVEMHVKSSEWDDHQHDKDAVYNTVILHVVWEYTKDVKNLYGNVLPCLELKDKVSKNLLTTLEGLMTNQAWVPCSESVHLVSDVTKHSWITRLMAERLEQKSEGVLTSLTNNQQDWEAVCFQKLAKAIGGQVNGEMMEILARITPLSLLYKHRDQLLQIESLLFGQSGLLEEAESNDEYVLKLKKEYQFLKAKYNLIPLKADQWKFLRMRPASFPTIRIAQLARLVFQIDFIFSKFLSVQSVAEVINMLDITITQYWRSHYTFHTPSTIQDKHLGENTIHSIIINAISPLMFAYGMSTSQEAYKEKAIAWLETLPAEKNHITKGWNDLHWASRTAMDSQALIHLKNQYCNQRHCLRCSIGHQIVKVGA